jgi:hypothetical protein
MLEAASAFIAWRQTYHAAAATALCTGEQYVKHGSASVCVYLYEAQRFLVQMEIVAKEDAASPSGIMSRDRRSGIQRMCAPSR